MTREDAYRILTILIDEEKIFSAQVGCAITMALDDMMIVAKLIHLKNGLQNMIDEIKDLEDSRGEK